MKCGWLIVSRIESTRRAWFVVFAALIATTFLSSSQAQVGIRGEARRPFRENVTLPVDSNLLKRFGTIEDLLADRRWAEAIVVLQEIAQTESKSLVLVRQGKAGDVASYLNVATRCNVLLSRIPAEGRADYRQKVDPQARRWFENWQRTRDEAELIRIIRQTFLSSYADDALLALGEVAWDRGDFSSAQSCWEQLVPLPERLNPADYPTVLRYPDSNLDQAAILARIILCSMMRRETDRAESELLQFAERYPEAEGRIAGQQGRYVDTLRKLLVESRDWKAPPSSAEVATFALSFERGQSVPQNIDIGALRWARSLTSNGLADHSGRLPFQNDYLSYHPVVYDNRHEKIVLMNDTDAIRAWNILTGEPAWKSVNPDPAVIYPSFPDDPKNISKMTSVGVPHYTMTISDDRLYARMGSPVTCASNGEVRPEQSSDLVCLDLKQEGKLVWRVASQDLFPGAPTWRYEGTPVVVGGRAYVVVCRRHPQLELMVICLDADDGRLLWQRSVGSFRASVDDSANRISHLLLTTGGSRIFLSTDLGAILALDANDGRFEWAVSYESRTDDPLLAPGESSRISLTPALYHGGFLFVAPCDANAAYCIEADSGRIHWQVPYLKNALRDVDIRLLKERQWKHLLGVAPGGMAGHLIVSGNSIWAIDVATGATVWTPGESALKRRSKGPFGRGLIAGDQVLLPLRESIEVFDVHSGELVRTVPLKTPQATQQGGNLVFAAGILLVAQPNRLAAYGEYSQLKERIEDDLTSRPDESAIRIRLAELEATEGQRDASIEQYHELLKNLDPTDRSYPVARQKFSRQLRDWAAQESLEGNITRARSLWTDALPMTDDFDLRLQVIFELAKADESLDDPAAAVRDLQRILLDERLSQSDFEKSTAGSKATQLISRLIAERGRGVYRDVEAEATAEFERLKKSEDRRGLRQLVTRYPHAEVAMNVRRLLVQLHRNSKEVPEEFAVLDEIRRCADDRRSQVEETLSILELLQHAGYTNSMKPVWSSLEKVKLGSSVEYDGKKQDLSQLVSAKLQELESKPGIEPGFVLRTWTNTFPNDGRVLIPGGDPLSAELASVFICCQSDSNSESWQWRCVDWRTGRVRWEVTAAEPLEVIEWTPVHLLFGTSRGWQARTAENGRKVWEQRVPKQIVPKIFKTQTVPDQDSVWPSVLDIERGLVIFDPANGNLVARLCPPGKLANSVSFGHVSIPAEQVASMTSFSRKHQGLRSSDIPSDEMANLSTVVLQTIKPSQSWIAAATSPRDEWHLEEFAEGADLWRTPPVFRANHLIGVTVENKLCGYPMEVLRQGTGDSNEPEMMGMLQSTSHWSFRNFPTAHTGPKIVSGAPDLLVVVDGTQLASFDLVSGSRRWFAGLVDLPMKQPIEQIAMDQDSVFATSQGVLRAISIRDGSRRFERYLGNAEQQWKTMVAWEDRSGRKATKLSPSEMAHPASLVATWPTTSGSNRSDVIHVCSGQSGELMQQLRVNSLPKGILINSSGHGVLWTDQSLVGLRFSSAGSDVMAEYQADK